MSCHIVPVDDLKEHITSPDDACWCRPTQDEEFPNVWVHNSMDRREEYETGERKLA